MDDFRAALARLQAAAAETPNAAAVAAEQMAADERFSPERVEAAAEEWRSGRSVDAARRAWRENDLPDDAFEDLLQRSARIETWMPLGEALMRIAGLTVAVAQAVTEESADVLAPGTQI